MKTLRLLLAFSLAANLALLLLAPRFGVPVEIVRTDPPPSAPTKTARDTARNATTSSTPKSDGGSDWATLRTDNLRDVVARLRAAGFPPKVIRAIVEALVRDKFAAHEQQLLYGDVDASAYWKQGGVGGISLNSPAKWAAFNQLNRERNEVMKDALGPDYRVQDDAQSAYLRRQYGDLPPDKIAQILDMNQHYDDLRQQVVPGNRGPLPDEAPKLMELEAQKHADLAKLLTPAELEQVDLRTSDTANYLRWKMQSFGGSESEYRSVYAIYQPYIAQYSAPYGNTTPQQNQARQDAEKQLLPVIAAALGPDRYADYQQATNPQYQQLNALTTRLDLPLSAARDVAAVQTDITTRAAAVRNDTTLTPDQRNAQLGTLAQEASTRISSTLGPSGLAAYQQYGGSWLQQLTARPAPKN